MEDSILTAILAATIVAGNPGGNCRGAMLDGGHDISFPDGTCPGDEVDPMLGPLRLEVHEAGDTFRDLPLVLGSIRTAQRSQHGSSRGPPI